MNKLLIATLTSMLFLAMAPAAMAQVAADANTPDWQSMSAAELLDTAWTLTGDAPAVAAGRQSIADQLATRFLADVATTRSITCHQWWGFAKTLSASLTAEQRVQWAGKLRAAYVQDSAGLASVKTRKDLSYLIVALGRLGEKRDDLNGVAAAFIKGTTHWQSWPAGVEVGIATQIAALGELGAASRQILITSVTSRYIAAGSVKSLSLLKWQRLTKALTAGLSEEAKTQWVASISQAFVGSGEDAVSLSAEDAGLLAATLNQLDPSGES